MSDQWRTPVDAEAFFSGQQRKLNIADRRPVRQSSEQLVGPGFGTTARAITDFNSPVASTTGFYSVEPGTSVNGPVRPTSLIYYPWEGYLGHTIVHGGSLGGVQEFRGTHTGNRYTRTFTSPPGAPDYITWGPWLIEEGRAPTYQNVGSAGPQASLSVLGSETLSPPLSMASSGADVSSTGTFARTSSGIQILRRGVYSGFVAVQATEAVRVALTLPDSGGTLVVWTPKGTVVSVSDATLQFSFRVSPTTDIEEPLSTPSLLTVDAANFNSVAGTARIMDISITRIRGA